MSYEEGRSVWQIDSIWVGEYSGLTTTPFDVSANADSGGSDTTSQTTGTTSSTTQADELAIATWGVDTGNKMATSRAYTNSFGELTYQGETSSGDPGLAVASKNLTATGTVESTFSASDSGDAIAAGVATFKEVGAMTRNPPQVDLTLSTAAPTATVPSHIREKGFRFRNPGPIGTP